MKTEHAGFGKTRTFGYLPTQNAKYALNYINGVGWHQVNDSYHCFYPDGINTALLIATLSGHGYVRTGSGQSPSIPLSSGSIALVGPHLYLEYWTRPGEQWEFYFINVSGPCVYALSNLIAQKKGHVFSSSQQPLIEQFAEICLSSAMTDKVSFELDVSQRLSVLYHAIAAEQLTFNSPCLDPVQAAIEFLEANYPANIHLSELSQRFYISPSHLIRRFKSVTGYTPYEYLKHFRLMKAAELLQYSARSVSDIGRSAGFSSDSNFISQFRQKFGVTPACYRRNLFPISSIEKNP